MRERVCEYLWFRPLAKLRAGAEGLQVGSGAAGAVSQCHLQVSVDHVCQGSLRPLPRLHLAPRGVLGTQRNTTYNNRGTLTSEQYNNTTVNVNQGLGNAISSERHYHWPIGLTIGPFGKKHLPNALSLNVNVFHLYPRVPRLLSWLLSGQLHLVQHRAEQL